MTVPEPLTDDIFDDSDEEDARGMDLAHSDLVAETMAVYSIPYKKAEDKVLNEPMKTKAEIARYWK